jgi:hypothetical protein
MVAEAGVSEGGTGAQAEKAITASIGIRIGRKQERLMVTLILG